MSDTYKGFITLTSVSDGNSSIAYKLLTSCAAIAKDTAGKFTPSSVTFTGQSQTGTAAPSNCEVYFTIASSTDGISWPSDSRVPSTKTSSYNYVVPTNGNLLAVKGSIFLDNGRTKLLGEQIIPIVTDGVNGKDGKDGEDGQDGQDGTSITIKNTSIMYVVSSSGTSAPPSSAAWSSGIPSVAEDSYLWTRTTVTYSDNQSTVAYTVSRNAINGVSPSVSTTEVRYQQTTNGTQHPDTSSTAWSTQPPSAIADQYMWTKTVVVYSDGQSSTSYSVSRNGANGAPGESAYTVYLTNENHTFAGTTDAAVAGQSIACGVVAYKGATQTAVSVGSITKPTGMSIVPSGSGTNVSLQITVGSNLSPLNGTVAIPLTVDGKSFTKNFSYSVALAGTSGTTPTVYDLEVFPSAAIKHEGSSITFDTTSITLSGYSQTGSGAREAYGNSFLIVEKRVAGSTSWAVASSKKATSLSYSLGTDNLTGLRCSLRAGSSSGTLLDQQIVPIIGDGERGKDAVVYDLQVSHAAIVKHATDATEARSYNPSTITLKAYRQEGNGAKQAYSSYYLKAESLSSAGVASSTSGNTASSLSYTIPTTGSDVASVRCSLLTSQNGTLIDQQIVPVTVDGIDGKVANYRIETSRDKINKFYEFGEEASIIYSPETFSFRCLWSYDEQIEAISIIGYRSSQTPTTGYSYELYLSGYEDPSVSVDGIPGFGNLIDVFYTLDSTTRQSIISENSSTHWVTLNLENIQPNSTLSTTFNNFANVLRGQNVYFIIKVYDNTLRSSNNSDSGLLAANGLIVEFGTANDMARFALTATSIQAAVDNSLMTFDASSGLTIENGGFNIIRTFVDYDEQGQPREQQELLLGYDDINEALTIKGNGEFTGTINAESGVFTGSITALDGEIGGFRIESNGLYSSDGTLQLLGDEAKIIANSIELGTSAHITEYIDLGNNARLWNPEAQGAGGLILEAGVTYNGNNRIPGTVTLTESGDLSLGSIHISGANSSMIGDNFSITPSQATFNNINATGKISTAVFEINKIQTMGGLMLFKPTYKVKSSEIINNEIQLVLEEDLSLEISQDNPDYVYLISGDKVNNSGYSEHFLTVIKSINKTENGTTVTVNKGAEDMSTIISMVHIGKQKDLIIGVNSTNATNVGLYSRGLTVSEFSPNVPYQSSLRAFLGDLGGLNRDLGLQTDGFGLYGENVYLTGSLTTKLVSNDSTITYAGINTINQTESNRIQNDSSPIIFWAGAEGNSAEAIGNSKFHVTKNGSLYAQQGIFSGLIQGAEIHSADIYAARIRGEAENDGLSLIDRAKINFCTDTSNKIFSIGNGGFVWGDNKTFISIDSEEGVSFSGKRGIFESLEIVSSEAIYTTLQERSIDFKKNNQTVGRIAYATDYVSIVSCAQSTDEIRVKKEGIDLMSNIVFLQNSLKLSEKMQYKQAKNSSNEIIGYDLVII